MAYNQISSSCQSV